MCWLGIDTSGAAASAAVVLGERTGAAATSEPRAHAAALPALIEEALDGAGLDLAHVGGIAVARGPGLFTGMRVGLAAGLAFGWARGLPVVGVSTLTAAARRAGTGRGCTVVLDARRREVFAQSFDASGEALGEPVVVRPDALVDALPAAARGFPVVADAALRLPPELAAAASDLAGLALEVALVASARAVLGEPQGPATPLYLRRPDVTVSAGPRSVLGQP
jgi:tRNA threonylcarbamoyl adenosine modification protein YeaZ